MQHTGQLRGNTQPSVAPGAALDGALEAPRTESQPTSASRRRVETVVETLSKLDQRTESLAAVAHDARNMVTALGLYCELLEEPGVLAPAFSHYGSELRLLATASRRLVEKLVALDGAPHAATEKGSERRSASIEMLPAEPIDNLAAELLANRNLLSALAGPAIALTIDTDGGARPVSMTGEDLTRVLVNLVKNASEAMPQGGRIHITLNEKPHPSGTVPMLLVRVDDNGPGIAESALERIFESGYSTRSVSGPHSGQWPQSHRGLGLSITRSIVEAAGGHVLATNRAPRGARFELELPVRTR